MKFTTLTGLLAMGLPLASAHTIFAKMYIDGEGLTDGTCIRMPEDGATATAPINGLDNKDMACGKNGEVPAAFTCPVSAGTTLTFEFREWPNASQGGSIDKSHRGPCSIYVKRVDDMYSDPAAGPGWTKIWHEGYDEDAARWCTEKLIDNKGLLTFELPSGLPAGYYLVRPELLALHQAASMDDPQYYVGCAQLHIQDGPSDLSVLAKNAVSIPGHVSLADPGNTFDVYKRPLPLPYPIPGPEPFSPTGSPSGSPPVKAADIDGAIPSDVIVLNANWAGRPLPSYSGESACWAAVTACFDQGSVCYDSTSPTGVKGCDAWNKNMCHVIQAACRAKDFNGPPVVEIANHMTKEPGPLPAAVNKGAGSPGAGSGSGSDEEKEEEKEEAAETETKEPAAAQTTAAPAPSAAAPSSGSDSGSTTTPVYEVISSAAPVAPSAAAPSSAAAAASSVIPAPAPSASASAAPIADSDKLTVSPDGTCGGDSGYTCLGSRFGNCCSRFGRCGRRSRACGCHCQSAFGLCNEQSSA